MELEPFSASLAAKRIPVAVEQEINRNLVQLKNNIDNDKIVIELDIEFHMLLAKATNNKVLMLSLEPLGNLLSSATIDLFRKVRPARYRLLDAHARIADAIFARDEETARTWMAKHIRDFRRGYVVAGIDLDEPLELHPEAHRSNATLPRQRP
jgi:DNA-binding FadR family transcriptional regulator